MRAAVCAAAAAGASEPRLRGLVQQLALWRARVAQQLAADAQRGWRSWVQGHHKRADGALYRWVRGEDDVHALIKPSPHASVLEHTAQWQQVWTSLVPGHAASQQALREEGRRACASAPGASLAPLSPDDVLLAVRRFSLRTAVGPDGVPPRLIERAGGEAISRLAQLLNASERLGC